MNDPRRTPKDTTDDSLAADSMIDRSTDMGTTSNFLNAQRASTPSKVGVPVAQAEVAEMGAAEYREAPSSAPVPLRAKQLHGDGQDLDRLRMEVEKTPGITTRGLYSAMKPTTEARVDAAVRAAELAGYLLVDRGNRARGHRHELVDGGVGRARILRAIIADAVVSLCTAMGEGGQLLDAERRHLCFFLEQTRSFS